VYVPGVNPRSCLSAREARLCHRSECDEVLRADKDVPDFRRQMLVVRGEAWTLQPDAGCA
jgi:hypothetical protein